MSGAAGAGDDFSGGALADAPAHILSGDALTLVDGSTFCISDPAGDFHGGVHGLFVRDTRVLSRWELDVDGRIPDRLSSRTTEPYAAEVLGSVRPRTGPGHLLVVRRRYVGDGMREDLGVRNHTSSPQVVTLTVTADADFADVFEVKEDRAGDRPSQVTTDAAGRLVVMGERAGHELRVTLDAPGARVIGRTLRFHLELPPGGEWEGSVEVAPTIGAARVRPRHPVGLPPEHSVPAANLRAWRRSSPRVSTGSADLARVLGRSIEDLGALRIFDPEHPERPVVAAGAPWFMAVFGRDSLLTSLMVLAVDTGLAVGTLETLAAHQGSATDPETEEQPGRILHEMRFGPATALPLGGGDAYYGTADATALFVIALGELDRWGTHPAEVLALLPHAERAMAWVTGPGDRDGDGFVEYARTSPSGLLHQGWKDSRDGVTFADGTLAEPPIALLEVQAYGYAAHRALAALLRRHRGGRGAAEHDRRADRLRAAVDERFWLPDRGWYACALDGHKRPVDALTSNMGHALWAGVVEGPRAARVAELLVSPEMFSGWGTRTLASTMGAYDPLSYHNGSVWPHDTALCAAGLARYGFRDEAARLGAAVLDAARHFDGSLPELFCGFSRDEFAVPVGYPTSCSPQAWAAAAPLLLLQTLLGFDPSVVTSGAGLTPAVPPQYLPLRVDDLQVGDARYAVEVTEDGWVVEHADGSPLAQG